MTSQGRFSVSKNGDKNKRPTMYDVAKLAGVSQPTVSRVLNPTDNHSVISDDTAQRVLDAVKKLGYRTNIVARSLRTQRTQTVALMIADIANAFYHILAREVQDVARQHGYEVLISNSDHVYENEKHFFEIVLARGVDGAILVPVHLTDADLFPYIEQTNIPFVVLGEQIHQDKVDVVFADDERAIYDATQWLIRERHHREIGFVGVPDFHPPGPRRYRGFCNAMQDAGLSVEQRFVHSSDFTLDGGKRTAREILATGELPSAFVVLNDLMAIGLILELQEAGVRVPGDVAILGFDDIPEATIIRPALTTIAQDPRDIGEKLANALFDRIQNPEMAGRRIFESDLKLIPRESA
jgi:LacI family transcriptional regulator